MTDHIYIGSQRQQRSESCQIDFNQSLKMYYLFKTWQQDVLVKHKCPCNVIIIMTYSKINPLPDDKILDWSKLKQIADDILECAQNEK